MPGRDSDARARGHGAVAENTSAMPTLLPRDKVATVRTWRSTDRRPAATPKPRRPRPDEADRYESYRPEMARARAAPRRWQPCLAATRGRAPMHGSKRH